MDLGLKGKRVLITGSSSGIGEAAAHRFATEGARVIVHGRKEAPARAVLDALVNAGAEAALALGALDDDRAVAAIVDHAVSAFGGIDILVHNAGAATLKGWFDGDAAQEATTLYNANVSSLIRLIQPIVPAMSDLGWGRIVCLSSITGAMPPPFAPLYSATKAAILNQCVSLSKALSGSGITVNVVSPGLIRTPATEPWFKEWAKENAWGDDWAHIEAQIAKHMEPNNVGRVGRPEEVADTIAFLASERASFITGTNVRIDGGANPTIA